MRKEYDFSHAKRNPYAKFFKKQVTINLEKDIVDYFKSMSAKTGMTYQNLINLFLKNCVMEKRQLTMSWLKT